MTRHIGFEDGPRSAVSGEIRRIPPPASSSGTKIKFYDSSLLLKEFRGFEYRNKDLGIGKRHHVTRNMT
jgi:hypothetical protein